MSWHFSRALVEEYSQAVCSDTVLYALSNEMSSVEAFSCDGKTNEFWTDSRYGMTFGHLMGDRGTELWTWFLEDSPAKRSVLRQEEEIFLKKTYGEKCAGLSERYALTLSLRKMYPTAPYSTRRPIYWKMDGDVKPSVYLLPTWVQTIYGKDFGYSHTPTVTSNFAAPSMQKHSSCRNFVTVFGRPSPTNYEYLMGWPIGWTDCEPLGTDKFHLWRQSHFSPAIGE